MDKVRIAIAGAGFIGRLHSQHVRQNTNAELVGIFAPKSQNAEKIARDYSIPVIYQQESELFCAPDIDAVILGFPTSFMLQWPKEHWQKANMSS